MNPEDYALISSLGGPPVALNELDDYLTRVCQNVSRAVPGSDAVGITVALDDQFITASYTDQRTLHVDAEQYAVNDGPCLVAYRERTVQRVDMEEAKKRWPRFAIACERDGVRGFLALPLLTGDRCAGALNLYSFSSDDVEADIPLLEIAAGRAADVLVASLDLVGQRKLVAQLEEALASRAVIEQAKGVLMVLHGLTDDEAFDILRVQSQRTNVKLREVARTMLAQAQAKSPGARKPAAAAAQRPPLTITGSIPRTPGPGTTQSPGADDAASLLDASRNAASRNGTDQLDATS